MDNPATRQPMSELELLRMQMNAKTDETLDSTRNMVRLCDESTKVGAQTLGKLESQGQQLRGIDSDMDTIREDLHEAQRDLDEIDKCCGLCVLPWRKVKPDAKTSKYPTSGNGYLTGTSNNYQVNSYQPQSGFQIQQNQQKSGPFITRITNDAREDEMEQNLQQVSGMVSQLHSMATDMNQEITTHNQILDRIDQKAQYNQSQLAFAQKRADKILGQSSKPDNKSNSVLPSSTTLTAAKMMMK
ncbi:unnamed protein product [Schistosoma margrebowiei]|uniref:Synaptosomal-associated protein n=1 Tax=Schistosoma margrebowiei TaxID=48269 RepID=A0AA84ZCX1_9TREM|nr:unnamed protein product [Schistosoma margrebowiei]